MMNWLIQSKTLFETIEEKIAAKEIKEEIITEEQKKNR